MKRLLLILLAGCAASPRALPGDLRERVRDTLAKTGRHWAVYYKDLDTGAAWETNADEPFHAASTIKVFVMIKILQDVHDGRYSLDDAIPVTDTFPSFVNGTPFKVDATAAEVRDAVGKTMTMRALLEYMITVSDNMATDNLIHQAGEAAAINACAARYGATKCTLLRYIQDVAAFDAGYSSKVEARDFGTLMERIWRGEVVSREASEEMLAVMSRLKTKRFIPAGLPDGVRVAHKTGWFEGVCNDVALVYREGRAPVVMVFLSRDLPDDAAAERAIAECSRLLYEHAVQAK